MKFNNTAGQATDNNTKRHLRFACCIQKATNAHSDYVILLAFPMTMMIWRRLLNVKFIACLIWIYFGVAYLTVPPSPFIAHDQKSGFISIYMIYLLTAIELSPGGSSTVLVYTQTMHRTIQNKQYIEQHNNWKSAGRAPSWLVLPWHLPYNRGKSTEKPQSG